MSDRPRPKKIVVIDWDARTLRAVHAFLGKRGVKIDRLLSVALPGDADSIRPELMGLYIRRALNQEGLTTRHAIVDIPRDQVILKTLILPAAQPEELPGMVEIQIAKELPFPVTEAVVDFAVTPSEDDAGTVEVLVAAIRKESLEEYEAIFAAAGLKLDRIGLRPYANKVAVCELLKHAMPERVLFVDVRPTFMEIDVLRNSVLAFSRSASVVIPKGSGESSVLSIAGADRAAEGGAGGTGVSEETPRLERVIDSLILEVTRTIEAYRANDPGAVIDHVVIGGDVGVEEMLAEAIQKRLYITTESYNPASTFGWEPDEGAGASAYAAPLGLVLGHAEDGALHFDFLHPKKMVSVAQQRLKKAPMVAAVAVLFIATAGVGLAQYTKSDRQALARLEKSIEELQAQHSENEKFLKLVEEIEGFDTAQHVWVDVLYDVVSLLPSNKELVLTHVDMNQKEGRLTLKTKSKGRETASELLSKLEEFREEGRDAPRFKVSMGPQTEKKRQRYPFSQNLRILILDR